MCPDHRGPSTIDARLPDPSSRQIDPSFGPQPEQWASHEPPGTDVRAARRQLALDGIGIGASIFAFGVVYGLAARQAGFSIAEGLAMSVLVLAGASQFAAVGLVAQGVPWPAIIGLTALLNARHLLYSAALAPWFAGRSVIGRAAAAHVLADETFALSLPLFRRIGQFDIVGYWMAASIVVLPWVGATAVGFVGGELLPAPRSLGLDVVFPAAMAGLAAALVTGRRELVAAVAGVAIGVPVALFVQPTVGIICGGLAGPLLAMLAPRAGQRAPGPSATEP